MIPDTRYKTESLNLNSDAIDDPNVSYSAAVVEAEDSGSDQVPMESSEMVGQQHVALVTQEDGTQQQVMERSDITNVLNPFLKKWDKNSRKWLETPVWAQLLLANWANWSYS